MSGAETWQIYSNAHFSLMAENASNVHDGIFRRRKAFKYPVQPVSIDYLDVAAGQTNTFTFYPTPPTFRTAVDGSPLSQRGWTLQERVLSARSVHLTDQGLFWSCPEITASEYCLEGEQANGLSPDDPHWSSLQVSHRWDLRVNQHQLREIWFYLCEQYSKRLLSDPLDKLPALSGVATLFQDQFSQGARFLAGIWSVDLPYALGWRPWSLGLKLKRTPGPQVPGLPSWSWASIQDEVEFPKSQLSRAPHLRAEVIESDTVRSTANTFGHVSGGRILLKGRFRRLRLNRSELVTGTWTTSLEKGWESVYAYLDDPAKVEKMIPSDADEIEFPAFLLFKSGESTTYILLLEHTGSSKPQEFRRLGLYLRFSHQRDEEGFAEDWEESQIELI
jgi:hypothetical protein